MTTPPREELKTSQSSANGAIIHLTAGLRLGAWNGVGGGDGISRGLRYYPRRIKGKETGVDATRMGDVLLETHGIRIGRQMARYASARMDVGASAVLIGGDARTGARVRRLIAPVHPQERVPGMNAAPRNSSYPL